MLSQLNYLVNIYKDYFGDTALTILDIGSRDGDDAKYLSDCLKSVDVYTFEANPYCYKAIQESYPQFNNIYGAISNYEGIAKFNAVISEDLGEVGCSSLKDRSDNWYKDRNVEKVDVFVNTMSNIIKINNIIAPFDLVKLDVEGCSFEVLEGFGDEIHNIKMLHVENETYQYWQEQKLAHEVGKFLTTKGFTMVHSYNFGVNSVDEVWINDNFI